MKSGSCCGLTFVFKAVLLVLRRLVEGRFLRLVLILLLSGTDSSNVGVGALVTATETKEHDDTSMPIKQMDHSKMGGMKHMEGMSMTGDVDYDFAANMRMHHQMAVDMSQAELKNGKNPQMLQMAKDIIAAQKKEITVLDQWMKAHKKP